MVKILVYIFNYYIFFNIISFVFEIEISSNFNSEGFFLLEKIFYSIECEMTTLKLLDITLYMFLPLTYQKILYIEFK